WPLDAQGKYEDTGSVDALVPVRLSELTGSAAASSRIQLRANLRADEAAYAGFDPVTSYQEMALFAIDPHDPAAIEPHFSRTMDIYDAQGGAHRITMSYLKTGPNEW